MQALTTAFYCFISKEDDTVENRGLEHPWKVRNNDEVSVSTRSSRAIVSCPQFRALIPITISV